MSKKLTMCKGLPASGKSTWVKEEVRKHKNQKKRINKDDLRDMIDGGEWSSGNEKLIIQVRDMLVEKFLSAGKHVIVDDTNFHPSHEVNLRELAKKHNAHFEVKFFDVDLEACIERDLKRQRSVGERVIKRMYNQYLKPKLEAYERTKYLEQDNTKESVVVFDVDGTVALMSPEVKRSPYDMTLVSTDIRNEPVCKLAESLIKAGQKIIFVSGRTGTEQCRNDTVKWISDNLGLGICDTNYNLYMRKEGDNRADYIIKEEIYKEKILPNYRVEYVVDDRIQVVNHIREMGLPVFQVAEGDF